jgi:zinc transport system ATP-binding protein
MENNSPIIQLENISAAYGSKTVLHDISLQLCQHHFLGIAGPNGGGKTTLLKLILGLMLPKTGTISFFRNGQVCDHLPMGYLPQQTTFDHSFPITVKDVVLSGALSRRHHLMAYNSTEQDYAHNLLEKVDLGNKSNCLIGQLSGGERQRALLARALMCQPEVLILDEPNTFFDIKARAWMLQELKEIQKKCAIIMVSHDLRDLFSVSDNIAYIHRHLHLYKRSDTSINQLEEDILHSNCLQREKHFH